MMIIQEPNLASDLYRRVYMKKIKPIKKESPKPINDTKKISKWVEDYTDCFSFREKPITESFIERLSKELVEWSLLENSLVLGQFYGSKGILRKTFYRWVEQYPKIAQAHEFAMCQLATKREIGGLTRKFDPNFAMNSLPMYDSAWRENVEWKSNLRKQEEQQQRVVVEISDLSKKGVDEQGKS
jgi:hypothetical protein